MAELTIRKTPGGQQQQQQQLQRQPQGMMQPHRLWRELMRWDPFSELAPMMGQQPGQGVLATFDVKETPEAYVFRADLPGFSEKDLELAAAGNRLTVSGTRRDEREETAGDTYYVAERRFGAFSRTFTLPQGVDLEHINAELKQGVLTVTVPRASAGPAKKISVKAVTKT